MTRAQAQLGRGNPNWPPAPTSGKELLMETCVEAIAA